MFITLYKQLIIKSIDVRKNARFLHAPLWRLLWRFAMGFCLTYAFETSHNKVQPFDTIEYRMTFILGLGMLFLHCRHFPNGFCPFI
jgi:hypothetical protein